MGGLKSKLPYTYAYLIGTSIAGIIPFAGFFSKDEILFYSFLRSPAFWILGAVAAIMTSFYMFRSVFMTFTDSRGWIMKQPIIFTNPHSL
jgi:NADH-quinone oxidoreductase subunit L